MHHAHALPHTLTHHALLAAVHGATAHHLHAAAHGLLVFLHQFLPFFRGLAGHPFLVHLLHFAHVLLPLLLGRGIGRGPAAAGCEQHKKAAQAY